MIHLHLCTISFRHHLVSLQELASWARHEGFDGIELWGIHARHLAAQPRYDASWARALGLRVPMISDYLPLEDCEQEALRQTRQLCQRALHWGAPKLRTFAGHQGSATLDRQQRQDLTRRLRNLSACVADHGLRLVVETHPNTLADTVASTRQLMEQVDHPALGLNFDVLHVWESGAAPVAALADLHPWVRHFHLKNIHRRDQLGVFAPGNVYSPAGTRAGMVPLLEGACDYRPCIDYLLANGPFDASLEWFGNDCHRVLGQDLRQLRAMAGGHNRKAQSPVACH